MAWSWARTSGLMHLTSQNGSQCFVPHWIQSHGIFLTWCQTRFTFPSGRRSVTGLISTGPVPSDTIETDRISDAGCEVVDGGDGLADVKLGSK